MKFEKVKLTYEVETELHAYCNEGELEIHLRRLRKNVEVLISLK